MISLNATIVAQPQELGEYTIQVEADRSSISGKPQRDHMREKWRAVMRWVSVSPDQADELIDIFTGGSVAYANDQTGVGFTGLAEFDESEYGRGTSHRKGISATLIEL